MTDFHRRPRLTRLQAATMRAVRDYGGRTRPASEGPEYLLARAPSYVTARLHRAVVNSLIAIGMLAVDGNQLALTEIGRDRIAPNLPLTTNVAPDGSTRPRP